MNRITRLAGAAGAVLCLGVLGACRDEPVAPTQSALVPNLNQASLRHAGTITVFDAPGAGVAADQGTLPVDMDAAGAITGYYQDGGDVLHGFVRTPAGKFTTFDAPGAGTAAGQGTFAFDMNPEGAITGWYADGGNVAHGFLRSPHGKFTTIDVPNAQGTVTWDINPAGALAGLFADANGALHGLVRAPNGKLTTFDAPGAGTGPGQGTWDGSASCINPAGAVTGWYIDAENVSHGFLMAPPPDSTITRFDVVGEGTEAGQGTLPLTTNPVGEIVGYYLDANSVVHGFLRSVGPPRIR